MKYLNMNLIKALYDTEVMIDTCMRGKCMRSQSNVLAAVHLTPAPGATPSFSLLILILSMLAIMWLDTRLTISLNSNVIPAFISLGFLQMAAAILSSTLWPIFSCCCAATLISIKPLFGLAAASNKSPNTSGLTRLFSILRDLREEFWSRTEHRVCTAKSLRSQLQAESFVSWSLFFIALKMSQKSCSDIPATLFKQTSLVSLSFD